MKQYDWFVIVHVTGRTTYIRNIHKIYQYTTDPIICVFKIKLK